MDASRTYTRREAAYETLRAQQQGAANRLSNYRLFSLIPGLALSYFVYRTANHWAGSALGVMTLLLFGYLALRHQRVRGQLRYTEALISINQKGTERAAGRWGAFADAGAEFADAGHPYASDLDLFGQGSLFQWISSAQTAWGREALARLLKQLPDGPAEIVARQEAVAELARKLAWRQRFEAEGLLARHRLEPTEPLLQWAGDTHAGYLQPWVKLGVRVLPAITIVAVVLYLLRTVPWQVPVALAVLQGLLLRVGATDRSRVLSLVYRFEPALRSYEQMLGLFESRGLTRSGCGPGRSGCATPRGGRPWRRFSGSRPSLSGSPTGRTRSSCSSTCCFCGTISA